MHTTVDLLIPDATAADVFEQVASLDRYPHWMRLVHRVTELPADDGRPAWLVELRARVGPFARSKQLRMVRTAYEPGRSVRFERAQHDGRRHAAWILAARVTDEATGAGLAMELIYTGSLWGSAALERVLEDEIRRGKDALRGLVTAGPRR